MDAFITFIAFYNADEPSRVRSSVGGTITSRDWDDLDGAIAGALYGPHRFHSLVAIDDAGSIVARAEGLRGDEDDDDKLEAFRAGVLTWLRGR